MRSPSATRAASASSSKTRSQSRPRVEETIQKRLAAEFPDHGIIGEELDTPPDPAPEIVWRSIRSMRQTGSAAVECAFVAAGPLRVSRFLCPNIWDVAAGR